jgi:hypothetical protein
MSWGQHLYLMQIGGTGAIKIGRSGNPARRRIQLQTGCPHSIRILLVVEDQGWREKALHQTMKRHKTRSLSGEWFHEAGWGDLPDWLVEQISVETLEMVCSDWWKEEAPSSKPGPS